MIRRILLLKPMPRKRRSKLPSRPLNLMRRLELEKKQPLLKRKNYKKNSVLPMDSFTTKTEPLKIHLTAELLAEPINSLKVLTAITTNIITESTIIKKHKKLETKRKNSPMN